MMVFKGLIVFISGFDKNLKKKKYSNSRCYDVPPKPPPGVKDTWIQLLCVPPASRSQ